MNTLIVKVCKIGVPPPPPHVRFYRLALSTLCSKISERVSIWMDRLFWYSAGVEMMLASIRIVFWHVSAFGSSWYEMLTQIQYPRGELGQA